MTELFYGLERTTAIFVLALFVRYCNGNPINITAGVGRGGVNITLILVNDSVTWYSAIDLCAQNVPDSIFEMCGRICVQYLSNTLYRYKDNMTIGDILWISRIKAKDDKIYKHSTCKEDKDFTKTLQPEDLNGQISCVSANISQPDIEFFSIDNCHKKHSYVCLKYNPVSDEYANRPSYTNISLSYDETSVNKPFNIKDTLENCDIECDSWFKCLGYVYDNLSGMCTKFNDEKTVIDGFVDFQIHNTTNTSINNVARFKFGKRVFYEWFTPSVSSSGYQAPEQNCNIEISTTAPASSPDCRYVCYSTSSSVNSTELAQKIVNLTLILAVDKKTLSSYNRKLTSAEDSRVSSKFVGAVATIIIITVVSLVTIGDVISVVIFFKQHLPKVNKLLTKH